MKRPTEKDLYSILGVNPDATAEEIRDAYLARTRVIHPDRFDRLQQPQDWKNANEMLAEMNEAYSILRNAASRAQYDNFRSGRQQRQATQPPRREPEAPPPPPFEQSELTPGQAAFASLPRKVQTRLLKRQQNESQDQFQIRLSSVVWNYVFLVILLCWYGYLFIASDGAKWKADTLFWYSVFTLVIGVLIGQNVVTICRWMKSRLKPYFYVTPIYFIKTDYDIVSFRPIWTLKDVNVRHKYTNGSYQSSEVVLKFDGYSETLSLSSKKQVEKMFERLRTFDARLRMAYENGEHQYFMNNDDFFQVPRSGVPATVLLTRGKQFLIYTASVFFCAVGLWAAVVVNKELSRKRWVFHPTPTEYKPKPTPQRVIKPPYSEQPLPYSGSVRRYTAEECIAPFAIKAAQGSHYLLKLVDANTSDPVLTVFVRSDTSVNVDVPLGTYEVRYASGESWFGYEYLFGPDTAYTKADKTFTFELIGNQVSGFTITLYKVAHGNLHTSTIKPTEF